MWSTRVVAESDDTIIVEGNHYFPPESVKREFFQPSDQNTRCHWKGVAHYYDLVDDGERNQAAAWFYPEPSQAAERVRGYIAFWKGVKVEPSEA
jgi:uncharacterized protein (DUF427 family)